MEIIDPTPEYIRKRKLPWGEIKLMALGDIQYGSDGCDLIKLRDTIDEGLDLGCWFGFMGDAHDVMSPSNRRKWANSNFYDNAQDWFEKKMLEDVDFLGDLLKKTAGRWAWWLQGHHYWEFSDGTTTDTRLCEKLEAPFVGDCGFLRMVFEDPKNKYSQPCDLWVHHGATAGSIVNKLKKIAGGFLADVYLMGHANQLAVDSMPLLELRGRGDNTYLTARDRKLVATGSFDRGYQVGSTANLRGRPQGGYVEKAAYIPTSTGCPIISITPRINNRPVSHGELRIKVLS